ncbi:MAG: hypothetical protein ACHQ1D_01310 [Nitrososphaerales archaeon]
MKLSIEEKIELELLAEKAIRDPQAFLSTFNLNRHGEKRIRKLAEGTLRLLNSDSRINVRD